MPLPEHVADFFHRHVGDRFSTGVVAISGGPDSVALAHLTTTLLLRGFFSRLVLAHLNHQLRGAESDADEAFVAALGQRWNLEVVAESVDMAALARGRNLEKTARDVRYAWLCQVARAQGASWIATGHTADDQAETVLHHLLRGAALGGLSGIAERFALAEDLLLLRPLLTIRHNDLIAHLDNERIGYRIDSTNRDLRFLRNRLRHEIIPLLEREINPAVIDVLVRTAAQAHESQSAITAIARDYLERVEKPQAEDVLVFSRSTLLAIAPFWVREVFRLVWKREHWPMGEMNAIDWRRLNLLVDGSLSSHDFPGGVHGRSNRHVVQLWMRSNRRSV